jgi:HEAT repeat protein
VPPAVVRLKEPDVDVRRNLVSVLGAIGDQSTATALAPYKDDRSREVATAASYAIERIKMTAR